MSSTQTKTIFRSVHAKTRKRDLNPVSLCKHRKRPRGLGSSPSLLIQDKLDRIRKRNLSDPPDTTGLKPFEISMDRSRNNIVHRACSVSSILKSKSANLHTGNHLPLANFMSF